MSQLRPFGKIQPAADAGPQGPATRRRVRDALGGRFDVHARVVATLLTQRPALRATADLDDVLVELVALRALLLEHDAAGLRPVLRAAAVRGLSRLPVHLGSTRWRPDDTGVLAGLVSGVPFIAPDLLTAEAGAPPPEQVPSRPEGVLWSLSGRRVDDLTGNVRTGLVVFGPGTAFAVLRSEGPAEAARTWLREVRPDRTQGSIGPGDDGRKGQT